MTSRSPSSTSRKKSAMQRPPSLFWRGKVKRATSRRAVLVEQDHVVALGGAAPIAVGGLRHAGCPRGSRCRAMRVQDRAQLLLRPFLVFVERAAVLPVAPLELVEHALVEVGHDRLDRHARDRARPPERRHRHRHAAVSSARRRRISSRSTGRSGRASAARPSLRFWLTGRPVVLAPAPRRDAVEIAADDLVHQREAVEGVARHRRRGRRHRT